MKRKSDFKSNGLDWCQLSQISRLFVIDRYYKNSKKHGNAMCLAWQHFGFILASDESVADVDLLKTKHATRQMQVEVHLRQQVKPNPHQHQ